MQLAQSSRPAGERTPSQWGYSYRMSGENLERLRAIYEQWAEGNFRAGVDFYDQHATLVQGPGFPKSGTYTGVENISDYMRRFLEAWNG